MLISLALSPLDLPILIRFPGTFFGGGEPFLQPFSDPRVQSLRPWAIGAQLRPSVRVAGQPRRDDGRLGHGLPLPAGALEGVEVRLAHRGPDDVASHQVAPLAGHPHALRIAEVAQHPAAIACGSWKGARMPRPSAPGSGDSVHPPGRGDGDGSPPARYSPRQHAARDPWRAAPGILCGDG